LVADHKVMKFALNQISWAVALVLLLAAHHLSFSQSDDPFLKIISGFDKYTSERPQEKVYIHFDRPYYAAGETIWFKAYLTEGTYHERSKLSQVIFVELIDEQGALVQYVNLHATNGSAAGHMQLPASMTSQNYQVRAYTRWMQNVNEQYFFHQQIKIWNRDNANTNPTPVRENLDVQFFPEGGQLVNGVFTKIAFKAIGADGLARKVNGKISEGENIVGDLKSNALGMGVFYLTPQPGKQYRAIIEGHKVEFALPQATNAGLTLSVTKSPSDLIVRVRATNYDNPKSVYVLGQTRGLVCYSARVDLTAGFAVLKVPKEKFPTGISQLTVADHLGNPVAERLVYIDQQEHIVVKVTPGKTSYAPRELVTLAIETKDVTGTPVSADLSLAVLDGSVVITDRNKQTINSYLYLSSELNGNIESPGYYFNQENADREEALEYLLLTQGWRRFTILQAQQDLQPVKFKPEAGLQLEGTVTDKKNKPVVDGKVSYLSVYPASQSQLARTGLTGEFTFTDLIYYDSADVLVKAETKSGSKSVVIQMKNSHQLPATTNALPSLAQSQSEFHKAFIAGMSERYPFVKSTTTRDTTIRLDEVEIHGKREETAATASRSYGKGTETIRVTGDAHKSMTHPLQLVQGRVAGVQVMGSGQSWRITFQGTNSIQSGTDPLVMVNETQTSIDALQNIPVQDIESVTIWKGSDAAVFGARGANGAIGFYTRKGSPVAAPTREGNLTFSGRGFQNIREFYVPRYDVSKPEHSQKDKRVTLFWSPSITTDPSGRASVSYYNHDAETTVTGIIEGISIVGSPGSTSFDYQIIKK
jgi:hypothetical protein